MAGLVWAGLDPGAGNAIQISHMDDENPTTAGITAVS